MSFTSTISENLDGSGIGLLTLGTTLGRCRKARLVLDSQRYMAQGHIQHVESAHLDI